VKTVQFDLDRTPDFVVMEISFLVALAFSNNQLAAKGLRLISHTNRLIVD
jgi:neurofibromin 1